MNHRCDLDLKDGKLVIRLTLRLIMMQQHATFSGKGTTFCGKGFSSSEDIVWTAIHGMFDGIFKPFVVILTLNSNPGLSQNNDDDDGVPSN